MEDKLKDGIVYRLAKCVKIGYAVLLIVRTSCVFLQKFLALVQQNFLKMRRVNFEYLCDFLDFFDISNRTCLGLIDKVISLIKMYVSKVENTSNKVPNTIDFVLRETNRRKSSIDLFEVFLIINVRRLIAITLFKQLVIRCLLHVVLLRSDQSIKGMKASFLVCH